MVTHSNLLVNWNWNWKIFVRSVPAILVLATGDLCSNFIPFSSKAESRYGGFPLKIVLAELTQSSCLVT